MTVKSRVFAPLEPIFRDPELPKIEKMILGSAGKVENNHFQPYPEHGFEENVDELSVLVPQESVFRTSGGKIIKIGPGDDKKKR